jgi:phosphate butyryltransferase
MPLRGFDALFSAADARAARTPVAVAGGADPTVLEALATARDRSWASPVLCGNASEIKALAEHLDIDLAGFRLVDSAEPASAAVTEVKAGRAKLLMKGQIATPALMQAMLAPERGLRTGRVICQVVLMEIPRDGRSFLLADTGICPRLNLTQKIDILHSTLTVARALGAEEPRVAVMAASEKPTDALPDTHDAAELQRQSEAGEFPGCVLQGPLSFDLAYAADAADKKRIAGKVTGAADVMLFPDLNSANLTVKAIMYTADCRFGGVLCGAACPVVFMSRADTTQTRVRSLALALTVADAM